MPETSTFAWIGFTVFVLVMLALDLGVFNRGAHVVSVKQAGMWVAVWVTMAVLFGAGLWVVRGSETALEYFAGYVIEYSLSMDNIFVFVLIFTSFAVPAAYQHRVLFWGIVGAIVMRAILIAFAGVLLSSFHWIVYVFGAFLIVTGIRFLRTEHAAPSLDDNRLVRLAKRFYPVSEGYEGQRFFTVRNGVRYMTPLFLVLILVETTDLVFAVDSIPAIYAITSDPFIVFTSNIMAILGLRAMYFVLAGYLAGLAFLKQGLAGVLVFVGAKMLLVDVYKVPALASLGAIVTILAVAVAASILKALREGTAGAVAASHDRAIPARGGPAGPR